jgi:phosphosulfolactate phosphohydrolase-like enzyme
VAHAAAAHGRDVVVIPAGLTGEPSWDAQEDWVAAVCIALLAEAPVGEGADRFAYWCGRIEHEGVARLFDSAPHAEKLRRAGLGLDIAYCAQLDITSAVPCMAERHGRGVVLRKA